MKRLIPGLSVKVPIDLPARLPLPFGVAELEVIRRMPRRFRLSPEGVRFRIISFGNRSGSIAWRVTGWIRDGRRIRENYPTQEAAVTRRVELENEFIRGEQPEAARVTTLGASQLRYAELAFVHLGTDADPQEI